MKCEICHEREAQTAIGLDGDGEELYVCKECAKRETTKRRKRREHTRKAQDEVVQQIQNADDAPPFVKALFSAVSDMVEGIDRVVREQEEAAQQNASKEDVFKPLTGFKANAHYMLRNHLHLEGLHIIGELEAVKRATEALGLRLEGVCIDGIIDTGHIYRICHTGNVECAKRTAMEIVEQERNARIRLREELPRLYADSVCRALAILKNCRMLSNAEYFDLLSPMRLAAAEGLVDGIKEREIERIMKEIPLDPAEVFDPSEERDNSDAALADEVNQRFEDVVLLL